MMRRANSKRTITILLFSIIWSSMFIILGISGLIDSRKTAVYAEDAPTQISIKKVDVPIAGRTSWANSSRPLGIVIYASGLNWAENQVHLQDKPNTDITKVTFTRDGKTANPVLICASKDGGYESSSFAAFFFAGDLAGEEVNVYKEGDIVLIASDFSFTTAEGTYTYGVEFKYRYNGEKWAVYDSSIEDEIYTEMVFTYIGAPGITEDSVVFRMKSSVRFTTGAILNTSLAQAVFINGQTLQTLIQDGDASVAFAGNFMTVTADKTLFRLDGTDSIKISKNAIVQENVNGTFLKTLDDEEFVYSHTLNRFELVPDWDTTAANSNNVTVSIVELTAPGASANFPGATNVSFNSIWITFTGAVNIMPIDGLHYSLEELETRGLFTSDLVNYGYAKMGIYASVMDYFYINGKSIREWMEIDSANGKAGLIRIEYLNIIANKGRTLRILAAEGTAMNIGVGLDQSIEFKKAFSAPDRLQVSSDQYFELKAENATGANAQFVRIYNAEDEIINADGLFEGTFEGGTEKPGSGCGSSVVGAMPIMIFMFMLAAVKIISVLKRKGENH